MTRIADALKHLEAHLSELRGADKDRHIEMVNDAASHLHAQLGPVERAFLMWVAYLSAEEDDISRLINADHRRELRRSPPIDVDPELWERVVSEHWPR